MKNILKVIRDNIYVVTHGGNYIRGDIDMNTFGNLAMYAFCHGPLTPKKEAYRELDKQLTPSQKKRIKKFFSPYFSFVDTYSHRMFSSTNGHFSPKYIPADIHLMYIDRYMNDWDEARFIDNKCYYYKLFSNVKMPEAVVLRIGKSWLDGNLKPVSKDRVLDIIEKEPEVFIKKATNSENGAHVFCIGGEDIRKKAKDCINSLRGDIVVQRPVKQHPKLAELNPTSVNTIRIYSWMKEDKVHIVSVCQKIGATGKRVDNGLQGGFFCGVRPDGRLRGFGEAHDGSIITEHPDFHYRLSDKKVPCLKKAYKLVKEAHAFMGHFRFVAWDVAIDEKGEAVLIECNLCIGSPIEPQVCNGPLFGKHTKAVLDEVFSGKKRLSVLL